MPVSIHGHFAFIVLDDGQRRESFVQTDAAGDDAAIVLFNFIDSTHYIIFPELVEPVPDYSVLNAGMGLENTVFR